LQVRISQIAKGANRVNHLTLAPIHDQLLASFVAGSHLKVGIPKPARVKSAPVSLAGSAEKGRRDPIVAHGNKNGRPVARGLPEEASPGESSQVSGPRCSFKLHPQAAQPCLVAGGSGTAVFFSHLDALRRQAYRDERHYAFKERSEGSWCNDLRAEHGKRLRQYGSTEGGRLDLARLLSMLPAGTHAYVCGLPRLMQSGVNAAGQCRIPSQAVHWDSYGGRPSDVNTEGASRRISFASGARHTVRTDQTTRQRQCRKLAA
jgi:ferredoxin-NADP reductase